MGCSRPSVKLPEELPHAGPTVHKGTRGLETTSAGSAKCNWFAFLTQSNLPALDLETCVPESGGGADSQDSRIQPA